MKLTNRFANWPKTSNALFAFAFCLVMFANTHVVAYAQVVAPRSVAPQDTRVEDSQDTSVRLAKLIERIRIDWQVPGLSVAIVKSGETVLCKGFGTTKVDQGANVDGATLFAIASNTKAFTAAALAILVDEGKLNWDDRVRDYLPWLELKDPLATSDLRVRDLLCHRSGLGTFSGDLLWWQTNYTPREVLERARHLDAAGPFRAHYGYSNLMFLAAGEIIEQVSGMPYADFVSSRILKPIGMDRTKTSTEQLKGITNVATPHKTVLDGSEPMEWVNWDSMTAAGGIISSAEDMARWIAVLLDNGMLPENAASESKVQIFSAKQLHEMWHPQTIIPTAKSDASSRYRAYGLGWSIRDYVGHRIIGHGGGYDGMYSQVQLVPESNLGVLVLTNSMTSVTSAITNAVIDAYLLEATDEKLLKDSASSLARFRKSRKSFNDRIQATIEPNPEGRSIQRPASAFVGHYRCPLYGDAKVTEEGGKLVLRLLPADKLIADLEHMHFNTYKIVWRSKFAWFAEGTCHFVDDANGDITRIELDVPNDDMWFYELDLRRAASN